MSTKANINEDVKDLISIIISNNKLASDSNISYNEGTEAGDGFLSKTLAVSISDDNQSLELFLKCGLDMKPTPAMPIDKYYANEIYFYEVIYPAYLKFAKDKGVDDGFRNIAKCYGTSKESIIALENIKKKGYVLCNKKKPLNDQHLTLVLKAFAKFHAISFAYKDQRKEEYDKLIEPTKYIFTDMDNAAVEELYKGQINDFLASLDPIQDKHILDGSDNLATKLIATGIQAFKEVTEDSILTQGDCWCNNMMFLYERAYSMFRCCLNIYKSVDISKFSRLLAFLKRYLKAMSLKNPKILEIDHINQFIIEANDKTHLLMKIILIMGYNGACRREDIMNMTLDDIQFKNDVIMVAVPKTKTYIPRQFIITQRLWIELVKKYYSLRPSHVTHKRFFLQYRNGSCVNSPIGINNIGKDENKEDPVDIILVDWQLMRPCPPVIDVSYFFYTVASEEALDNLNHYLKVYHDELSQQIRKFDSDPDILYPFTLMQKQWKEKSMFGVYMAFMLIRLMLSEKDETLDMAKLDFEDAKQDEVFPTIKNNKEYYRRMKVLVEHLVVNEFL